MKDLSKKISLWITAAIVLTIGILCIVAGAAAGDKAGADAYKGITLVLGIVSLVALSPLLSIEILGVISVFNDNRRKAKEIKKVLKEEDKIIISFGD